MRLKELLEIATSNRKFNEEGYSSIAEIYEDLQKGSESGFSVNFSEDVIPIELECEVTYQYVVFDSCPHYPALTMSVFTTLKSVESHLSSPCSYLNGFTGFSVVFNNGEEMKFDIMYKDKNGSECKFIKQETSGFDEKYPFARVCWRNA